MTGGKLTQEQYQALMEGNDLELMNSDDNEDITAEVIRTEGGARKSSGKGTKTVVEEEYEEEIDGEVEEVDEELEDDKSTKRETSYGKEQVQKIVQTRVNTYQKKLDRLKPYKEAVDKICEVTGLDFDKLVTRLSNMSVQEQAKILGIPVEKVQEVRQSRTDNSTQKLSRQIEEMEIKTDKRYSDYDLYKEDIEDLIEDNPKLTLKQAYLLVKGDSAVTAAARDAEQRTIARQVNSHRKGVVKQVGGVTDTKGPKIDQTIVAAAKRIGMDPVEYAKYQDIDNLDAYRASKSRK
jgi:hypothetical protein